MSNIKCQMSNVKYRIGNFCDSKNFVHLKLDIGNSWRSQAGFSPLLLLLPIALIFVVTVLFVQQGRLGNFLSNRPAPTPASLELASTPQVDEEGCNDPYNADCFVGDDEGDDVRPEDLIGPD